MNEPTHKPVYGRGRFPKVVAKGLCRGCHGPVTDPRRRTWCSEQCANRYDPYRVKLAVISRDRHICQLCGIDAREAYKAWQKARPPCSCTKEEWRTWRRGKIREEYDHILPFSEGGATVLENMRTLCSACHKKVTAEWRRLKKGKSEK